MSSLVDRSRQEQRPSPELVLNTLAAVTQKTAIHAYQVMIAETGGVPIIEDLPKETYKPRAKKIDNAASDTYNQGLRESGFTVHVIGDEGQKDIDHGEEVVLGFGIYGDGPHHLWVVRDVVEGTKFVAHSRPNAVSITAVSDPGGLMETPIRPDDGKRVGHMRKLFVPRGVNPNSIWLDQPPEENVRAVARTFGRKPSDVLVVTMKRDCNAGIVNAVRTLGTEVLEIDEGDLAWCMRASLWTPDSGEKPIIYQSRGGWEEGVIAHVVAKLMGAPAQGRIVYEKSDIEIVDKTPIFTEADAASGSPKDTFVTLTAITPNEHFNLRGISPDSKAHRIHAMHVTHRGVAIAEENHPLAA